jgi:hypothetical protein
MGALEHYRQITSTQGAVDGLRSKFSGYFLIWFVYYDQIFGLDTSTLEEIFGRGERFQGYRL